MVLSPGQRDKLRKGREVEESMERTKLSLRVGDVITEPAEYTGVITKISNDIWQNVSIDQGIPGTRLIKLGAELQVMVNKDKLKFQRPKRVKNK